MILNILFLIISIVSSVIFLFLLFTSKEFDGYIEPIDEKDFALKEFKEKLNGR